MFSYKIRHYLFSWNVDTEGDIMLSVISRLHFVKYKEHTIVKWGKLVTAPAAKYVQATEEE